jgi:protein dithiol oxidoreductase (disulfide-forming)
MIRFLPALLALLLLLPLSVPAAPETAPVAGEDYVLIDGGQPYQPLAGKKIEVVEVFGYWCHHCAEFQPRVEAWKQNLPADVRFTYVPAVFSDDDPYARAYFAAADAGALGRTHDEMFRAIHDDRILATNATIDEIAWFYGEHGLVPAKMKSAMTSAATTARLQRAREFALRSGVEGTPSLVINGRYRVRGRTHEDTLRIASQLIAQLRTARR